MYRSMKPELTLKAAVFVLISLFGGYYFGAYHGALEAKRIRTEAITQFRSDIAQQARSGRYSDEQQQELWTLNSDALIYAHYLDHRLAGRSINDKLDLVETHSDTLSVEDILKSMSLTYNTPFSEPPKK